MQEWKNKLPVVMLVAIGSKIFSLEAIPRQSANDNSTSVSELCIFRIDPNNKYNIIFRMWSFSSSIFDEQQ